jgi:hypothetical protein
MHYCSKIMNLTTTTPAQRIAVEIEGITAETIRFVQAQLARIYALANTPGEQAAIMQAFGANGVAALQAYGAFHAALSAVGVPAPIPDLSVFQPQADGSVAYIAPPENLPDLHE